MQTLHVWFRGECYETEHKGLFAQRGCEVLWLVDWRQHKLALGRAIFDDISHNSSASLEHLHKL